MLRLFWRFYRWLTAPSNGDYVSEHWLRENAGRMHDPNPRSKSSRWGQ